MLGFIAIRMIFVKKTQPFKCINLSNAIKFRTVAVKRHESDHSSYLLWIHIAAPLPFVKELWCFSFK